MAVRVSLPLDCLEMLLRQAVMSPLKKAMSQGTLLWSAAPHPEGSTDGAGVGGAAGCGDCSMKNKSLNNDALTVDSQLARVIYVGGMGRGDRPKLQLKQNKTAINYYCLQGRLNSS